jgi:hypothetical protein
VQDVDVEMELVRRGVRVLLMRSVDTVRACWDRTVETRTNDCANRNPPAGYPAPCKPPAGLDRALMTQILTFTRRQVLATSLASAALAGHSSVLIAWTPARVLRIGNQKGGLSILKKRGKLEKRLAPLGVSVTWSEFNAGPVQLEALNVGAIDFGDGREAPPIFAQAAGAALVSCRSWLTLPAFDAAGRSSSQADARRCRSVECSLAMAANRRCRPVAVLRPSAANGSHAEHSASSG